MKLFNDLLRFGYLELPYEVYRILASPENCDTGSLNLAFSQLAVINYHPNRDIPSIPVTAPLLWVATYPHFCSITKRTLMAILWESLEEGTTTISSDTKQLSRLEFFPTTSELDDGITCLMNLRIIKKSRLGPKYIELCLNHWQWLLLEEERTSLGKMLITTKPWWPNNIE